MPSFLAVLSDADLFFDSRCQNVFDSRCQGHRSGHEKFPADGIITDDSDVFLFGGTYVYRHFFNQQKYCELFKADDLERNMRLDRDRLIRLAYLVGSDYTVGLKGLGPVTSLEILREWDSYGIDGLIQFKEWAKDVQNLKHSGDDSGLKIKLVFLRDSNDREKLRLNYQSPNHSQINGFMTLTPIPY